MVQSHLTNREVSLNVSHGLRIHASYGLEMVVVVDVICQIQHERYVDESIRPICNSGNRDDDVTGSAWSLNIGVIHAGVDADVGENGDGKYTHQDELFPAVRNRRHPVAPESGIVLAHLTADEIRDSLDGKAGDDLDRDDVEVAVGGDILTGEDKPDGQGRPHEGEDDE